jgi:hypothetical protein
MASPLSPDVISIYGIILVLVLVAYRATLPKPLPGIPYVKASASRPFGDMLEALRYQAVESEMLAFLTSKCVELNSPIVQLFMRPFGRPWVIVVDSKT